MALLEFQCHGCENLDKLVLGDDRAKLVVHNVEVKNINRYFKVKAFWTDWQQ